MGWSAPAKALAFAVFFVAIAGAVYGVAQLTESDLNDAIADARERFDRRALGEGLVVRSAHDMLNASPGNDVTFTAVIENTLRRNVEVVVELEGAVNVKSRPTTIIENSTAGVFLTARVPADATAGDFPLTLRILRDDAILSETKDFAKLRVLAPGDGFAPGDAAQVAYTVRLTATDKAHRTSDPALFGVPFPRTDDYRALREHGVVIAGNSPALPRGAIEALLGMQLNESRTVSFGAEKGFGPAVPTETRNRVETLPRVHEEPNRPPLVAVEDFEAATARSIDSFSAGDRVHLVDASGRFPYRIERITPTFVEIRYDFDVGQRITFYPPWTNGSEVLAIDNQTIRFLTTPTSQPGDAITLNAYWPEMSTLVGYNETQFTIQHNPQIGWKYTEIRPPARPREAVITGLTPTQVEIGYPSENPLAGDDLTYDLRIVNHFRPPGPDGSGP